MTDLKNKIALITGPARGIGKSIALRYASKDADIVVNYSRDKESADEAVREIEALGVRAIGVQANVAMWMSLKLCFKRLSPRSGKSTWSALVDVFRTFQGSESPFGTLWGSL
jgi:3-oxoacyl-[acyl-carrier protein] reductase